MIDQEHRNLYVFATHDEKVIRYIADHPEDHRPFASVVRAARWCRPS